LVSKIYRMRSKWRLGVISSPEAVVSGFCSFHLGYKLIDPNALAFRRRPTDDDDDDDETSEIQTHEVIESAPLPLPVAHRLQNQDIINWAEGITN
jgi:hypothetical protein